MDVSVFGILHLVSYCMFFSGKSSVLAVLWLGSDAHMVCGMEDGTLASLVITTVRRRILTLVILAHRWCRISYSLMVSLPIYTLWSASPSTDRNWLPVHTRKSKFGPARRMVVLHALGSRICFSTRYRHLGVCSGPPPASTILLYDGLRHHHDQSALDRPYIPSPRSLRHIPESRSRVRTLFSHHKRYH